MLRHWPLPQRLHLLALPLWTTRVNQWRRPWQKRKSIRPCQTMPGKCSSDMTQKKTVKNLLTKSPPVSISCELAPDRVRPDLSICETPRRHRAGFFKGQHRMSPRFPVKSPIHQLKADLTPNFCAGKRHQELRPSLPRASWNWDWSLDR